MSGAVTTRAPARRNSAFVPHDLRAPLRGAAEGPLVGLTAAVKDMYDIAGERTGGGSPDWLDAHPPAATTSPAVRRLLEAGADVVGKTVCDEFFFSVTGANAHYGMPFNARAPGRLPGGSSSGSAAAVGAGACDIALGSDTGGSVRIPAAFNGIYGLRPTHGRVDLAGAMAMAPSFDAAGWFAAGPGLLRKVGRVLLDGPGEPAPFRRVLLCADAFAEADHAVRDVLRGFLERAAPLLPAPEETVLAPEGLDSWRACLRIIQGREFWEIYGGWIETHRPKLGPGIRERVAYAASVSAAESEAARSGLAEACARIRGVLAPGTVMLLPTAPCVAPRIDSSDDELESYRTRVMRLICPGSLGGVPQLTLPAGRAEGGPVGLSLLGWAGGDEALLDLAVLLGPCCGG